jgi:branched-chain amino acid transport system ATP-binding protein
MLQVKDLHAYYGKSHVLHGVSFSVGTGEIVALLGRNGSGRSTTAKAIMGLVDAQGSVDWLGQQIVGRKPFEIAHLGLGYVPENRDIFPKLTVHQNLLLGLKGDKPQGRWDFEDMYNLFPRLRERQHTEAGVLSGGEQQRIGIARALYKKPEILILDESTSALDRETEKEILKIISNFRNEITVIIVSHKDELIEQCQKVFRVDNNKVSII